MQGDESPVGIFEVQNGTVSTARNAIQVKFTRITVESRRRLSIMDILDDLFGDLLQEEEAPRPTLASKVIEELEAAEAVVGRLENKEAKICPNCGRDHLEEIAQAFGTTGNGLLLQQLAAIVGGWQATQLEQLLGELLKGTDDQLTERGYSSRVQAEDHLLRLRAVLAWQPAPAADAPAAEQGEGAQQ